MDFWTFLGFAAVLALLAAIEKQLIAIHKDIVETKVKVDYINALVLKKEPPLQKLPGNIDASEPHQPSIS
jgi:hypothetical protein